MGQQTAQCNKVHWREGGRNSFEGQVKVKAKDRPYNCRHYTASYLSAVCICIVETDDESGLRMKATMRREHISCLIAFAMNKTILLLHDIEKN